VWIAVWTIYLSNIGEPGVCCFEVRPEYSTTIATFQKPEIVEWVNQRFRVYVAQPRSPQQPETHPLTTTALRILAVSHDWNNADSRLSSAGARIASLANSCVTKHLTSLDKRSPFDAQRG
jgi:hypothetical protein